MTVSSHIRYEAQDYLHSLANAEKINDYRRFFKTAPGEYGEGDNFLGVKMPDIRKVVKRFYKIITIDEIEPLLYSEYHEERMLALLLLVAKYQDKKSNHHKREAIFQTYLHHMGQVNNWDLVDVTAPNIIGTHLLKEKEKRDILYEFANEEYLWVKRIAIISTFTFIRNNQFYDTLNIADILLHDEHDLIHKAVGWMLREVGNRNLQVELNFLNTRYKSMPRTMLRYAIEKFDEDLRQQYLKGTIETDF